MIVSHEVTLLLASLLVGAAVVMLGFWIGPVWDVIARRQVRDLTPRLQDLNLNVANVPLYLRIWGACLAGSIYVVGFVLRMPLVAPAVFYLIYVAPRIVLQILLERRRFLLRDQMVGAAVTLANTTRAGLSLAQGLETLSNECPEPLATEFRKLVRDYHRGRPLAEAIRDVKARLNQDGFSLFANAVLTCLERGGKITEALERISKSLQENQRLDRKLEADTASGRKVVLILGLFPFGFLGLFYFLDMDATGKLFSTIIGQLTLVVIMVLVYAGVQWARRLLKVEI